MAGLQIAVVLEQAFLSGGPIGAQMARNEHLYRLISEMRQEIRKTRIQALHLPQRLDYSLREHDEIFDAFLKRNPALAESIVRKHLANQMTAIKQSLRLSEA
jgi:DNA-binding GntR family transcriptional regulator